MKLLNATLALSVFVTLSLGAIAQNPSIEKIKMLTREGQYSKVLETINQGSQDNDILLEKGWAYLGLKDYEHANEIFQQLYTKDPKNAFALAGLGARDLYLGNKTEALLKFDKASKINKKNPAIYAAIASSCLNAPKPDTALAAQYIDKGMNYGYEKSGDLHVLSGDLNLQKSNYGEAVNNFQRALYYDPNNFEAQRKIGIVYFKANNFGLALEAFTKSINMNPAQILIYKNLGDLYYRFRKWSDAQKSYQTYMEKADVDNDDIERYAFALFFNKQYKESLSYLDKLMVKGGSETVYLRLKGYMAYEMGDFDEGLKNMEKFFSEHPANIIPTDYACYARLLAKRDRDSLSILNYENALKIDSTSLEYMDELAKLYSRNKLQPKAIATYQKMLGNGADQLNLNYNIAREYYFYADSFRTKYNKIIETPNSDTTLAAIQTKAQMTENFKNSLEAFKKIKELSPASYSGFLWSGRIGAILDPEWTAGDDAKTNYEQALTLLEKTDTVRNKKSIIECLKYLGSYYYLNSEKLTGDDVKAMKNKSIEYFERIAMLDPSDTATQDLIKALKDELTKPPKKEAVKKK
jgi:tetratricopeptide (TPR) repeat protein